MGKTLKLVKLLETQGLPERIYKFAERYGITAASRNWNVSEYLIREVVKMTEIKKDE